jgi:hypothetical protein
VLAVREYFCGLNGCRNIGEMDQHPCKPTAKKAVTLSDIKAELRAINKRLGLDFPLMFFKMNRVELNVKRKHRNTY